MPLNQKRHLRLYITLLFVPAYLSLAGTPALAQTNCKTQTDIPEAECNALLDLFSSTIGAGWTTNTGWNVDNFPCAWHGVTCAGGQVTNVLLGSNQLSGTIPTTLGNLGAILVLNLSFNQLSGSIPIELGSLSSLQSLRLQSNNLTGAIPTQLGNLTNLVSLFLFSNSLNGSIPTELGNLSPETIRIDSNNLTGSIPTELGNLGPIQTLDLGDNDLTGTIPSSLGNLNTLQTFRLENNDLSGTVPFSVAQVGAAAISICDFTNNNPGVCFPDILAYQGLGDPICGLALDGSCTPLPVELASFLGIVTGQSVALTWKTLTETNNAGFEVQLRREEDWRVLVFVQGHGTTTDPQDYSFAVNDLDPGLHRFRLKQIDLDGVFEYSSVVEAAVTVPDRFLIEPAYPNPFNPTTTLRFAAAAEQHIEVTLINAAGQTIRTLHSGTVAANEMQQLVVDASTLPSGTYLVHFNGDGLSATERIVLMK